MKRKASVWSSCAHVEAKSCFSLLQNPHLFLTNCGNYGAQLARKLHKIPFLRVLSLNSCYLSNWWYFMVLYYTNWCQQILQYIFNILLARAQPLPTLESRKPVWIQRLGVCTGTVRSPNLHVSRPSLMKCAPSNWTSGIKLNHATVARYSKIYHSHAPWNVCLSFWCSRQRKIHRFFFATSRICRFTF